MAVGPHPGRGHQAGRLSARARGGGVEPNSPLPSGERVARRAGEGDMHLPDVPPRATPSP
ncbi:hypothetical protein D9623_21585 [Azospirillum brasilense]|uniref:Uncharacterized protein n=1 Tax=Azospirillum brasilense TaxID=192 RepID=A0A4D8QT59_AZOBR|nr:hypothetical protein D3868_05105 [Azospirillum brasilense]QEL90764.1 hypothetical protein D9621_11850 [Azospirillum brasilense]QEL95798.1 hypothetical protein D9623_04990 [Azospirillum brasilense]QEL98931.1 hypothetical protein D9623_21585 [Azospirillum brasilense]